MTISDNWITAKLAFDLETTPLEIKTDSVLENNDLMTVTFFNPQDGIWNSGRIIIYFESPQPKYKLVFCKWDKENFQTSVPDAREKVWRITKTRTSGIRIQIHCNDVEVLNVLLSDSTCPYNNWNTFWSKNMDRIRFNQDDTASRYFRAYSYSHRGKNLLFIKVLDLYPLYIWLFFGHLENKFAPSREEIVYRKYGIPSLC